MHRFAALPETVGMISETGFQGLLDDAFFPVQEVRTVLARIRNARGLGVVGLAFLPE